jgi:CRP/FNR family transcriptional regulator, polysaccharide utilization system transcription regulator
MHIPRTRSGIEVFEGQNKDHPGQEERLKAGCPDCRVLSSTLFRSLSEEEVRNFSCIFCPTRYHRNQILFFEGGSAQHLFALNVGLVKLVKSLENGKERITRILFPGDLFGLEALNQDAYPLTAVVLEDSEICSIPRDQFFAFLRSNPDISLDMIRLLVSEISEIRSQITDMSFKDARMRVATFLLTFISPREPIPSNSCSLTLPLSSQEIAEILELSPETVSRTWNAFRQEGLIQKRGRHLNVKDLHALEATARR